MNIASIQQSYPGPKIPKLYQLQVEVSRELFCGLTKTGQIKCQNDTFEGYILRNILNGSCSRRDCKGYATIHHCAVNSWALNELASHCILVVSLHYSRPSWFFSYCKWQKAEGGLEVRTLLLGAYFLPVVIYVGALLNNWGSAVTSIIVTFFSIDNV